VINSHATGADLCARCWRGPASRTLRTCQGGGRLAKGAKPDALAAFLMAVLPGLAMQAKVGIGRTTLKAVADQALAI